MGVYHAMILVDLFALCLGVGTIFAALLSWERSGIRWLGDLALVLVGATVLLVLDLLRNYTVATGWPDGGGWRIVFALFSGVGNLVLVLSIPVFVRGIVPAPLTGTRRALGRIGLVLLPLAGVLDEATGLDVLRIINDTGVASLLLVGTMMLIIGYGSIGEPETRRMVRRMTLLTVGMLALIGGQIAVINLVAAARELRHVRFMQVLYYLGMLGVVFVYAVKYLFRPVGSLDVVIAEEFLERYGISRRERDIITMVMQGYANRVIGERLFISDRTVKNHISSIYRKTGVVNKVQLLNMVRNHPGSSGASPAPRSLPRPRM